jgi:HD-like signal output (HDOD) protein
MRGYAGTLAEARARRDRSITATEHAAHQTDHAIVGALVARTWHLAPDLRQAIRLHHDPSVLPDTGVSENVRSLVAIALVAEHLVHQHEQLQDDVEWVSHGHECLRFLQIGESELLDWRDALHDGFLQA